MDDATAGARIAQIERQTRETRVRLRLNLDGAGEAAVDTGIGMLDHLLEQISRHGLIDLQVEARGDLERDAHHTVEDLGICLGQAFSQALDDRRGIVRMAHAIVPLDEALAMVAVDLSGRGHAVIDLPFRGRRIGTLPVEMIPHFLQSFAFEARLSLHVRLMAGENDHHRAECVFKALARALSGATRLDPRIAGIVPSSKGVLER